MNSCLIDKDHFYLFWNDGFKYPLLGLLKETNNGYFISEDIMHYEGENYNKFSNTKFVSIKSYIIINKYSYEYNKNIYFDRI